MGHSFLGLSGLRRQTIAYETISFTSAIIRYSEILLPQSISKRREYS
jgi:hypothetical protein